MTGSATRGILLRPGDDVCVVAADVPAGGRVRVGDAEVVASRPVPRGHKVALRAVEAGAGVHKYGQLIGLASRAIAPGDHVHTSNLAYTPGGREGADDVTPEPGPPLRRTFEGYVRGDGRVGTRNYLAILTSVNCSASTARMVARAVESSGLLEGVDGVDGVVALTHSSGCGLVPDSFGGRTLLRTLRGYADHPNVGGLLVLGLGCEMIGVSALTGHLGARPELPVRTLTIQDAGGIRTTVRAALELVEGMMPQVTAARRTTQDAAHLVLGLNCGGSDGFSGITANPGLGVASDLLVRCGGKSVLAETPEIFGAEHLLTHRAASPEVAAALLARIDWWQEYLARGQGTLDNNPSPGNKAGGLTTILEKSLGAVAKAGTAPLRAVYDYAGRIDTPGLGFMDTPGYDPVSVTGLIAGGATVVAFTTGRGSVIGTAPTPTLKLATTSELYARMPDDMDLDCGTVLDGREDMDALGARIFEEVLAVASGRRTASEELRLGEEEFVPWQLGAVT